MKFRILCVSVLAIGMVMFAGSASANSVAATTGAALGPLSSNYGLDVNLTAGDTTPTYVMAGPGKGFNNETTLKGSFFINHMNLNMAPGEWFQMMDFLIGFGTPESDVRLIFFLHRDGTATDYYFFTAWHWNENTHAFQFSGNGFFALPNDATFAETLFEFEWTAGNPGSLSVWRTGYLNGSPSPWVPRTQILNNIALPGMQTAAVNYVFCGAFNKADHPAVSGDLYMDEFVFTR